MSHKPMIVLFAALLLAACTSPGSDTAAQQSQTVAAPPGDQPTAPLLEGIGSLHFPITTTNPLAQKYFDQALTLAYGFNHAEAVRSFKEAARLDPTCGICWAGAALALGPNINAPMAPTAVAPAWHAIQQAQALKDFENEVERAYIDTIATRYSEEGSDRAALDVVYAGAMAGLVAQYPDDLNARTLYAESLMDLMPWEYWQDDGTPSSDQTLTLVEQLEHVMAIDENHPGAIHLYIHAMERFEPEKAEAGADRLLNLVPVAGHLVHMPSHIYLRVGRYADAVDANARAAMADEDYIAQCNAQGLYPAAYYPHNIHFLWYAAMMEGRKALAVDSALKLAEKVPMDMAAQMGALQSYIAVPVYTYVRFGMWQEVLDLPMPADNLPFALAMSHYGRGLAQAALGNLEGASTELAALQDLAGQDRLRLLNMRRPGVVSDLTGIAESLVRARIARDEGNASAELAALQQAVAHQDALPYTEPPLWHYPVRQTLGEAQIRAGEFSAAKETFAEDLIHFPANPWSLFGLESAQRQLGENVGELTDQRKHAWRNSDIDPAISW